MWRLSESDPPTDTLPTRAGARLAETVAWCAPRMDRSGVVVTLIAPSPARNAVVLSGRVLEAFCTSGQFDGLGEHQRGGCTTGQYPQFASDDDVVEFRWVGVQREVATGRDWSGRPSAPITEPASANG